MKRIISTFAIAATLICTVACNKEKHFITDKDYRTEMEKDYSNRPLHEQRRAELSKIMNDENISLEEKEALKFLYAYMPLSDIADYSAEFFLEQVRGAFRARDTFAWGNRVPEDIFRHFVLVYRVNNENLDSARNVFFNELKDRIKDMTMYDAALEVNHWCHEKVTYRPSDARTSAPLATMRTALGRCGEESTFTVTAMRAVGIPARQCYTPRWAHTDDNHAWVEVWVDGKWYYLGACEPDAKLNMGWFSIPTTRCMMVHSNAFGKYKGNE
ncbi:MAG: transglutaminase domain-containing protein, partial [Bacteroidales bacterium]|nr:transglutaminase domain-containing protein [Bacteroidales bacterium]